MNWSTNRKEHNRAWYFYHIVIVGIKSHYSSLALILEILEMERRRKLKGEGEMKAMNIHMSVWINSLDCISEPPPPITEERTFLLSWQKSNVVVL
jgi:hypothetical protein